MNCQKNCYTRSISQQSCVVAFLKKICHIPGCKSSFMQMVAPNIWHAEFVDSIIKLTSVTWRLFPSTCWAYRHHSMKNLEVVWSRWSPGDHNLFQLLLGSEKVATGSNTFHKNFQNHAINGWRFTSNLWQFYGNFWYQLDGFKLF